MASADFSFSKDDSVLQTRTEVAVEWKIRNFFNQTYKENYKIDSPFFMCSGIEWFLQIFPNGRTAYDSVNWIALYLRKRCNESAVSLLCSIGIKKAESSVFKIHDGKILRNQSRFGLTKFCSRSDLFDLIDEVSPDGVLTIFCNVKVEYSSVDAVILEKSSEVLLTDSLPMLSRNFKELYLSGSEGDIKIRVKEKDFTSHKAVLAARCPVFKSMLELDMAEKNSGAVNIIDCDPDCFNDFMLFLYSGELNIVTIDNALGLYFIADKYDVTQLKEACCDCMKREISVESVCDIVLLATLHNETELLDVATDFFTENANRIVITPKWVTFLTDNLTLGNELLIKLTNKYIK